MTPAARYAAAIDVLDQIIAGQPAERCLTNWGRNNRYAGSKDRAAVRDHVYDVLRAKRSLAARGSGTTGRALVLGLLRREGIDPDSVFGAARYGPFALTGAELLPGQAPDTIAAECDMPEWLWPHWHESLGERAETIAKLQQQRAPVALRVNLRRNSREEARDALAGDDITTDVAEEVETGLIVTGNARRIAQSPAYRDGLVELQDIASQIAMARLRAFAGARVLDYCAGGGGKALALADQTDARITAHDVSVTRMKDIPIRAARAGVPIEVAETAALDRPGSYDMVLCDAPCSGSGTWRRTPESKWLLTDEKLNDYNALQGEILMRSAPLVRAGGTLAYATCSVLRCENGDVMAGFQAALPGWQLVERLQLYPSLNHDGFFLAIMRQMV